jgi:Ca2+-binding EF-hand superfamily protein
MKFPSLLLCVVGLLAFAFPASVHAAKDPEKKAAKKAVKAVLAEYDKNNNGIIDGEEVDAVRKAYEADPNGPLKRFDLNSDGKLDDTEIAAIHLGKHGKKNKTAA